MFLIEDTAVLDDATPDDEIEFDEDLQWYRDLAIHESYWEQYNNQQKGAGCVVRMENRRWHYDEVARRSVWISSEGLVPYAVAGAASFGRLAWLRMAAELLAPESDSDSEED